MVPIIQYRHWYNRYRFKQITDFCFLCQRCKVRCLWNQTTDFETDMFDIKLIDDGQSLLICQYDSVISRNLPTDFNINSFTFTESPEKLITVQYEFDLRGFCVLPSSTKTHKTNTVNDLKESLSLLSWSGTAIYKISNGTYRNMGPSYNHILYCVFV